ncbi:MAG: hypothetical protein GC180_02705 [Bacteroidetes bacterium]|nr:hypothetical protein [Bacteroidota bacterium]
MRFTLLSMIHKALRSALSDDIIAAQQLEFNHQNALSNYLSTATAHLDILHIHAELEDEILWPLVKENGGELVRKLETDHVKDAELIEQCRAALRKLENSTSAEDFTQNQIALIWEFSELLAFNLMHMNIEEQQIHPLLWEKYDDMELQKTLGLMAGKSPKELFMPTLALFKKSCSHTELSNWYNSIPKEAPIKGMVAEQLGFAQVN